MNLARASVQRPVFTSMVTLMVVLGVVWQLSGRDAALMPVFARPARSPA